MRTESIAHRDQSNSLRDPGSSRTRRWSSAHTLASDHSVNRRKAVTPDRSNPGGSWFQVHPEVATKMTAASTSRSPRRRRPPPWGRAGTGGTTGPDQLPPSPRKPARSGLPRACAGARSSGRVHPPHPGRHRHSHRPVAAAGPNGAHLWWSGQHRHLGWTVQVIAAPDSWPSWVSPYPAAIRLHLRPRPQPGRGPEQARYRSRP